MSARGNITAEQRNRMARALWSRGDLRYLLHPGQESARDAFYASSSRIFPLLCSRRWGKSLLGAAIAAETCMRQPGAIVRIAAPTAKMVRQIVEPHMRHVHTLCPRDLRPVYRSQDGEWRYPNGSIVQAFGCDNGGADRGRGTEMHLGVIEEAGFVTELRYVVQDVFLPQLLTTGGRILMPSSPPRTPAHDFATYINQAEEEGTLIRKTIWDALENAPHITEEAIEDLIKECGGTDTTTWLREFGCEVVTDESLAVVPEFRKAEDSVVEERERPTHFDTYVCGDFGFHDMTVVLFGYLDFVDQVLVVEDELAFKGATTDVVAPAVLHKEQELWDGTKRWQDRPYRRIADMTEQQRGDLASVYRLPFGPAKKDDADAALAAMRVAIGQARIRIHPRCTTLISHIKNGIWNTSRTSFARSDPVFGHFDAIDALKYLWRHVDWTRNPFPMLPAGVSPVTHLIPPEQLEERRETKHAVRAAFRRR